MNTDILLDAIGEIGDEKITDAEARTKPARRGWVKWAAAATAVAVIAGGVFAARSAREDQLWNEVVSNFQTSDIAVAQWSEDMPAAEDQPRNEIVSNFQTSDMAVAQWSEDMPAADYFKYNRAPANDTATSSSASLAYAPYAALVPLSDERAALEAERIIPEIPDHPEQNFWAYYNGDGSIYKVRFHWMRRGSREDYSDLQFTAAPRELRELSDVISIAVDENGSVIAPNATVTERDGVQIVASGYERGTKALTWQDASGWRQIEGSWNDSYADVVALLDWFWDHPLDLDAFFAAYGDPRLFVFTTHAQHPEAFQGAIPDFEALGWTAESDFLSFAEQTPVYFEGIYTKDAARVRWTVKTTADGYDIGKTIGFLRDATEDATVAALQDSGSVTFDYFGNDAPCRVTLTLESDCAPEAWELIESLQ